MEDFKMKKSFLKFLPLMAAVMLTTACSKDDENQDMVSPDNKEQIAKGELIPFSIKVATNHKLSKAGSFSEDENKNINIAFHANDVNTLKMTLQSSVDFGQVAYLTLTNINGTFEGEIPASWVGQTIKATVGLLNNNAISSDISLLDLMGKCNHPLAGEFKVGVNSSVTLTDQNAYFEIKMSPLQHKLDVSINGAEKTVDLSKDGIVWIAVNTSSYSFADFKTNFYTKAQDNIKPGQIYTINREGFVDLGLSNGTLWADKNVGANTFEDAGNYYRENDAALDNLSLPTGDGNDDADMTILKNECTWKFVFDENDPSVVKGFNVFKKNGSNTSTEAHIYLPAAGSLNTAGEPTTAENVGFYWSSSTTPFSRYGLKVDNSWGNDEVCINEYYDDYNVQCSVRTVRHKN